MPLSYYQIDSGVHLKVETYWCVNSSAAFRIRVETISGKIKTLYVNNTVTFEIIRHMLQDCTGCSAESIVLYYNHKPISNEHSPLQLCTGRNDVLTMQLKKGYMTGSGQSHSQQKSSLKYVIAGGSNKSSPQVTRKEEEISHSTYICHEEQEKNDLLEENNGCDISRPSNYHNNITVPIYAELPHIFSAQVPTAMETAPTTPTNSSGLLRKLTMKDHHTVVQELKYLYMTDLLLVAGSLRLDYRKTRRFSESEACFRIAEAWISEDDYINTTPCWDVLAQALEENQKSGKARDIRKKYNDM